MNTSQHITLDQALDAVMLLPFDQRNALLEILKRRQREERVEKWAREAEETLAAYRRGEIKAQSVDEIIEELHRNLEEDDEQ
ncbi:MAG TPA: hypothetical protein VFH95_07795 [Candidatus Kapabacteria bacterium]|nr:hypothetical protein [Candidatus Kapabacteria bacterium]